LRVHDDPGRHIAPLIGQDRRSRREQTRRGWKHRLTLGEADKQVGQYEGAGDNSYRSSSVKVLAGLAAYPWALCAYRSRLATIECNYGGANAIAGNAAVDVHRRGADCLWRR